MSPNQTATRSTKQQPTGLTQESKVTLTFKNQPLKTQRHRPTLFSQLRLKQHGEDSVLRGEGSEQHKWDN